MAPVIPMRFIFRSKWAALAWAAGICWSAIDSAGGDASNVDANNAANVAQIQSALDKIN